MKKKHLIRLLLFVACFNSVRIQAQDPFKKIKPVNEKISPLPLGSVKPNGWLLSQMQQNLAGYTGHLDSLVPDLIIKDEIFGRDRLSKKVKSKDVGAIATGTEADIQFLWWNSETQGNWLDGYVRSAILTHDESHLNKISKLIDHLLATQDADGYLGIYDTDLRYTFNNENGELWAKTTLLRTLLAWYDYTKSPKVLMAVEKAVQNMLHHYPEWNSHPFYSIKPDVGGTTHGLVINDVLEQLYRITKKNTYRDYCTFLYADFSSQILNEDAQYKKLMDVHLSLKGHSVHTYEHLRSVAAAWSATGNPQLQKAIQNFLTKIDNATTASGAGVGDEWIAGQKADATSRGYEYCSLQELMHAYINLMSMQGNDYFGEKTEKIFFNAAQGARHPTAICIAYLKTDNSYFMTGGLNGDSSDKNQTRYKYSPVQQDVAVCCVPNAGRIAPYYVQHMWMQDKEGIVASLLGPCELTTKWNGQPISIIESTDYPFQNTFTFTVKATKLKATIKIRRPLWAENISLNMPYKMVDGFIVIEKVWDGTENITLDLKPEPRIEKDVNGEHYFMYGALVLAHPIESIASTGRSYGLPGFHDWYYQPAALQILQYPKTEKPHIKKTGNNQFEATLFNPAFNRIEKTNLVPIGQTILRQVTFKSQSK